MEYRSIDVINTQVAAQMQIKDKHQYNWWTREKRTEYSESGAVLKERENPFGIIPAVSVIPLPSIRFYDDRLGVSLVQDIVALQKLVLNLMSLILDWHESANFALRVLVQDTQTGDEPPTQEELAEGGNRRGIILKGSQSRFEIVSPDAQGVLAMCEFLNDTIERILQSAFIPSDANLNKTHQSAQTIRSNLSQLYNRLTRISKHFEKAMRQVIEMALRVQGIDPAEAKVKVQWDTNFSYDAFIVNVQQLQALKQAAADMSATAVAEYAKRAIGPQLYNSGKMEAIEKELNGWAKAQQAPDASDEQVADQKASLQQMNAQMRAANKIAAEEEEGV